MGKAHTMAGSQFRATTASHMVDLQGSNVRASPRAVIVAPATAGIAATFSEPRHDLGTQFPLSYSALTLSHVYTIHSSVSDVNQITQRPRHRPYGIAPFTSSLTRYTKPRAVMNSDLSSASPNAQLEGSSCISMTCTSRPSAL